MSSFKNSPLFDQLTEGQKKLVRRMLQDDRLYEEFSKSIDWSLISDANIMAVVNIIETLEGTPEGRKLSRGSLSSSLKYLLGTSLALGLEPFTSDPTLFSERINYVLEDPTAHLDTFKRRVGLDRRKV